MLFIRNICDIITFFLNLTSRHLHLSISLYFFASSNIATVAAFRQLISLPCFGPDSTMTGDTQQLTNLWVFVRLAPPAFSGVARGLRFARL